MGVEAVAALTLFAKIAFAIAAVATTVMNLTKSKPKVKQSESLSRGLLSNTCDVAATIPVVYGRQRIGINRVFLSVDGADNKIMHLVGVLCEGEIEGIATVGGVQQVYLGDKLWTEYGSLVYFELFTGTSTQNVCSTLHSAVPEWTDPLRYTAYIYVKLEYDQDYFQSLPEITVVVDGKKVYNPATGLMVYTVNGPLHARDYLTSSSRRGGMGIASSRINDTTVTDAATYFTTAKGWSCNLTLKEKGAAIDGLVDILNTFRGDVVYTSTELSLKYRDLNYESSVMDIGEDDIVDNGGSSSLTITQPDIFNTPNAVNVTYLDPGLDYEENSYVLADSDAITADGDYRENDINLPGVSTQSHAMQLANYWLERLRVNKKISFKMGSKGLSLEPFDLVRITHSRPGWTNEMYRITEHRSLYSGEAVIEAEQEESTFYDDTYDITPRTYFDTSLPSPQDTVCPVTDVSIDEEQYYYRGRTFTRLNISFSSPATTIYPWWDYADVYLKIGSAGEWKFMTKAVSNYILDPVEEGETYYFKLVSVSKFGTKQAFATGMEVSKTVVGKNTNPPDVTGFTVVAAGDAVVLYANSTTDPDVEGWEVRLGDAWAGGVLVGFNETPNVRLAGVKPGTHTFWCAFRYNNGLYSETPSSAQVTVFYPSGYVDKNTWSWDFDGIGTHDNTEHTTYNTYDALKCSHTGDVLAGTWTSPEYDLGSLKTVRVWGDFLTAFESDDGTWSSLFGTSTWADVLGTKKWYEIVAPDYAGILTAKIKWGTSSGVYTNEADRFELCSVEFQARYIQVEVTITDPFVGSNLYLYTLNMKAAYWS